MCLSVILLFILAKTAAEEHGDHFNTAFAPSTVNFNEIFTNSLTLADDPPPVGTKDEDFHLSLPSQFVEFRPHKPEVTTTPTPPPPMYILNSSYLKKNETEHINGTFNETTIATPITDRPEECSVNVIPIVKEKIRERGVLDLLFPAKRVKGFKNVFDTFRRILSYTFRKR